MSGPLPVNDTVDMAIREIIREYVFFTQPSTPGQSAQYCEFCNERVCLFVCWLL